MKYEPSRQSDMDKIFMARELYAAVDHMEENLLFAAPDDEPALVATIKQMTKLRRDVVGSLDGDKNYACLFKHMSGAAKAAEEVWLADGDSEAYNRYKEASQLFSWVTERFIGKKIEQCDRCNTEKSQPSDGSLQKLPEMRSTTGLPQADVNR